MDIWDREGAAADNLKRTQKIIERMAAAIRAGFVVSDASVAEAFKDLDEKKDKHYRALAAIYVVGDSHEDF